MRIRSLGLVAALAVAVTPPIASAQSSPAFAVTTAASSTGIDLAWTAGRTSPESPSGRSPAGGVGAIDPESTTTGPIALVYRGRASCAGCSEALAALLRSSKWNFNVKYVGPNERLQVTSRTLATAAVYAQPGGDGTVNSAYNVMKPSASAIRGYVKAGGRYLGMCMGAYLEGTPGFDLLPGNTDSYISSAGATIRTTDDAIVTVSWRGVQRYMYFQDGTRFVLRSGSGAKVLARYPNKALAAVVVPFGAGHVAGTGPHPEADASWYGDLDDPDGLDGDLGRDLIDTLMTS